MPRANYGDRFTVTAMQDDNHVTFNLTSRVIDFLVTEDEEKGMWRAYYFYNFYKEKDFQ